MLTSRIRGAGCLAVVCVLALAPGARAQHKIAPKGVGSEGYVWNENWAESLAALRRGGDVARGEVAYRACAVCHLPSGSGQSDGTYPQIAGQHGSVLIKQIADIRDGRRDNPVMLPFVESLSDSQELADLIQYISRLRPPLRNGVGPGNNVVRGEDLYGQDCQRCHGAVGQGDAARFYPIVGGQHYEYLLRQLRDMAAGRRRNANPEMVEVVAGYRDADLRAVADFLSQLPWPGVSR